MSSLRRGDGGAFRKAFGNVRDAVPVPNLIEIQSKSFNSFAQLDYLPSERRDVGMEAVLRDVFPISGDRMSLEYVSYELGNWACTCGALRGLEERYKWACDGCKAKGCSRLVDGIMCPKCGKPDARYRTCPSCLSRVSLVLDRTMDESRLSGKTFSLPMKVRVKLTSWDVSEDGTKSLRDIKEQEVFFTDVPVMGNIYEKDGSLYLGSVAAFLINGIDRVVVSQLHRSPGAVFTQSKRARDVRGRPYYLARLIPMRGSWIDFEFDSNDNLHVRIDKKKRFPVTTFLQALGIKKEDILPMFYDREVVKYSDGQFYRSVDKALIGLRIEKGMVPEKIAAKFVGKRVTPEILKALKADGITRLTLRDAAILNRVFAEDLVDQTTGELVAESSLPVTPDHIDYIRENDVKSIVLVSSSDYVFNPTIANTLAGSKCNSEEGALKEFHSRVWPGGSATLNEVRERLRRMFFDPRYYDLTRVGRIKINRKLGLSVSEDKTILDMEDIIATIRYMVNLREKGEGELDDIDHLGNRRVRLVGELLSNQFHLGLARVERLVREKLRVQDPNMGVMPQDLLNVNPLASVMREFFGTGQLSQFMDQTNPLSEIAHKRRLSALGPGGITKDRATFEVRDVHTSHYGRICPVETPEGQTIGLISSLATYALVNDLGFIETAYRPVVEGKVKNEVVFMDAFEELTKYIAEASSEDYSTTCLKGDAVLVRHAGTIQSAERNKVDYIDASPGQLVSVSTALIPFLEHDDASRALMGANMQRQAVPLIRCEAPIVGTGMETEIGRSSSAIVKAHRPGLVEYVSADRVIVRVDPSYFKTAADWIANGVDTYTLRKFQRSSYRTLIHQSPIVKVGDRVEAGEILTDGSAVRDGELSLGSNITVAFMPWHGYNFEDAIVISKDLVADDTFTSVHVEEYSAEARDTKLGPEEITADIPNISEHALDSLDDDGVVRIGTRVKPGDILVGKVTLKGDVQYSPEEKLLRAIFGEKSREVRDTSLRVPPGIEGTVIDVKVFSRSGARKDRRHREEAAKKFEVIERDFNHHAMFLEKALREEVILLLAGSKPAKASEKYATSTGLSKTKLRALKTENLVEVKTADAKINSKIDDFVGLFKNQIGILERLKESQAEALRRGDELPSGVIKVVKVYIAMKRPISVGDKIAGRHGNKGVVSIIVPREDMPYMEDGTPVDIVFNPLGVPSRMNVGQILESLLGLAGVEIGRKVASELASAGALQVRKKLTEYFGERFISNFEQKHGEQGLMELKDHIITKGVKFATPVFDGADYERDISPLLGKVGLPAGCSFELYDGRTGEKFDQKITAGAMYVMKLIHMVDDKLHARSVGPYSLVTQQPLGGKAQFGGQRLGEMEVWALEAYGAAYALQEMLTYKSDDVSGRHKVYDAIVHGEQVPDPGIPESFNVFIKELQSLGLQIDLFRSGKEETGD